MKMWIRNQITQFAKSYEYVIASFYAQTSLQMTIHNFTSQHFVYSFEPIDIALLHLLKYCYSPI
ncbi:IS630 family transposase [Orientia tsutsugamushi]|uniref:IS630 family transposase n=1 Tax=Orientia tsutsugamushi TaxID=784 RepID=A0A2R8F4K4_ORITS|nr:IS630 family transposase [Orientia tsutsugamushi]